MRISLASNKTFVTLGDSITYTIRVENENKQKLKNVVLIQNLPKEITLGEDSLNDQLDIGDMEIGDIREILRTVLIAELPKVNPITSIIDCNFQILEENQIYTQESNPLMIVVNDPNIGPKTDSFSLELDKEVVDRGEILTCTIKLKNIGNIKATGIKLIDLIPVNTSSVSTTDIIDGTLTLADIEIGEEKTISYQLKVDEKLEVYRVVHKIGIEYKFLLPNRHIVTKSYKSKSMQVVVETASFLREYGGFIKSVDKLTCDRGDYLTYTMHLTNIGNRRATEVRLIDTIPRGAQIVGEGVYINGEFSCEEIEGEITLPSINPQETIEVMYQVSVMDILPIEDTITTFSEVSYNYISCGMVKERKEYSEVAITKVYTALVEAIWEEENVESVVTLGDQLYYKLRLKNQGNIRAQSISIELEIPQGTYMINKDVLGKLNLEATQEEEVPVILGVNSLQQEEKLRVGAKLNYTYSIDERCVHKTSYIQTKGYTRIEGALFTQVLSVIDKDIAQIEDTLNCNITLQNTGNVEARNIVLVESLPRGIVFIENDLKTEQSKVQRKFESTYIQSIYPLEKITLTYKIRVEALPDINPLKLISNLDYEYLLSNTRVVKGETVVADSKLYVQDAYIHPEHRSVFYEVDKVYARVGDILTYKLKLTNMGNVEAHQVRVILPVIECGTWGKTYCIREKKETLEGQSIEIGQIDRGEEVSITYYLEVIELPKAQIQPLIKLNYQFEDKRRKNHIREYMLSSAKTIIYGAYIDQEHGGIKKISDKVLANVGDEIVYTTLISNTGNIQAEKVVVVEKLSEGLKYIKQSLYIDGQLQGAETLDESILLECVLPGETKTLSYKTCVQALPKQGSVKSISEISYVYYFDKEQPQQVVYNEAIGEDVFIYDTLINSLQQTFIQKADKDFVVPGDTVSYTVEISNHGNTAAIEPEYTLLLPEGVKCEDEEMPLKLPDILPGTKQSFMLKAKIDKTYIKDYVLSQGKLMYGLRNVSKPIRRIENTEAEKVQVCTAGPHMLESFFQEANKIALVYQEKVQIICKVNNEGNQVMKEVVLKDNGIEQLCFEVQSILINEKQVKYNKAEKCINLEDINPGESCEVKILNKVIHIPKEATIEYERELVFAYLVHSKESLRESYAKSNKIKFIIQDTGLGQEENIQYKVDKTYAEVGEELTYQLVLKNSGNIGAEDFKLDIEKCNDIEYLTDTLKVRGQLCKTENIEIIHIAEVSRGETLEISFKAKVLRNSIENKIEQKIKVSYKCKDSQQKLRLCELPVQSIRTDIRYVDFSGENYSMSTDKTEVTVGEILSCQIRCINGGNVTALQAALEYTLSKVLEVLYDSLEIDSEKKMFNNKENLIFIGDIAPRQEVIVKFKLRVRDFSKEVIRIGTHLRYSLEVIPQEAYIQRELDCIANDIYSLSPEVQVECIPQNKVGLVGDIISYLLKIENTGNVDAYHLRIENILPQEMCLVSHSLGTSENGKLELCNPKALGLEKLVQGELLTLTYQGQVEKKSQKNSCKHTPKVHYEFMLREQMSTDYSDANQVEIMIEEANVVLYRRSNKEDTYVEIGEQLTYIIKLVNEGSLEVTQILFYEKIPVGVMFIEGSFKIQDKNVAVKNLQDGINIGILKPGESCMLTYKVKVEGYYNKYIESIGYGEYLYEIDHQRGLRKGHTEWIKNKVRLRSPNKIIKKYRAQVTLPYEERDLYQILEVKISVSILESKLSQIETQCISIKGQIHYSMTYKAVTKEIKQIGFTRIFIEEMKLIEKVTTVKDIELYTNSEKGCCRVINPRQVDLEVSLEIGEG